jgi:hypothetical protein
MIVKVASVKQLASGQGAKGPWTLVEATFDGQNGVYKGFYYEKPIDTGSEIDVEFSNEEYKGKMEARFKQISAKRAASGVAEMAIKTEVARYGQEILRKLDLIMTHLEIKDFKADIEKERNKEPMKPTWEDTPNDVSQILPDDIPF